MDIPVGRDVMKFYGVHCDGFGSHRSGGIEYVWMLHVTE